MFWTELLIQKNFLEDVPDDYLGECTISKLIVFSEQVFPDEDANFHRRFAFLTHRETQRFLRPLLVSGYGGLDAAKLPTLDWLEGIGTFETFARSTRAKPNGDSPPARLVRRGTPSWYLNYLQSDRFQDMKKKAEDFWGEYMDGIHCSVNARDPYEVMHHSDYARLGSGDEFRYLVPLCNACHCGVTARGPNVPAAIPLGVKRWL